MDAHPLGALGLLQHDELADVGLHEEQQVEEDGGQEGGEGRPNGQRDRQAGGRDKPVALGRVGHLYYIILE